VQNVLDGVPEAERGVGHGKCGLPAAISDAVRAVDDPHGASAAAMEHLVLGVRPTPIE
jgi:hypothetical protein